MSKTHLDQTLIMFDYFCKKQSSTSNRNTNLKTSVLNSIFSNGKNFEIIFFLLFTSCRLKQMEEEFYKFVNPAEIAKDLNLPKELATKIHKYWALKRKVLNERTNE